MSRIVVISGGGTGIGQATAERFALDGDQVVIIGRRMEVVRKAADEINAAAAAERVTTLVADLSEPDEAERVAADLATRFGRVDILVNNAGGNVEIGASAEQTGGVRGAAWHWLGNFRSNVLTAVLLTEAVRGLLASPGGRVLLFSSIAAYRGSGSGSYAGAKAALHPYAFDLASQLGPKGVTVNVLAPGYIGGTEFFRGRMTAEREQTLISQTPTGRVGEPGDVAATVHWLASPEAAHVHAQVIQVNGGALTGR